MFKTIWLLYLDEFFELSNRNFSVNRYWKAFGIRVTPDLTEKPGHLVIKGGGKV
ncbi:hypothetical protein BGX38DRAFT_1231470 [Terfezia claveryi]|nr:hypothetical protein BGX38DRAFT_1231470 [Terfezia claveryi]